MPLTGFFRRAQGPSSARDRDDDADALVEGYVAWREGCAAVRGAYERWTRCTPADQGLAFAGYTAALEREEHAASVYESWVTAHAGAASAAP